MHAWRYWLSMAERSEKTVYEIRAAYYAEYQNTTTAELMILDDPDYRVAVGDQQFATRQAGLYADAVQVRLLEAILAELTARPARPDGVTGEYENPHRNT